jgi:type I restriction enzyme S subunit
VTSKVALEDACEFVTDGTHYTPKDVGAGVPFLTVKDVSDRAIDLAGCSFISEADYLAAKAAKCAPRLGDVLFSKDGTVGKVHVVATDRPFAVLSSLAILRPRLDTTDAGYLGHALRAPAALDQALEKKTGSAIRRIVLSDLRQVRVPLPPLPEQRRVAAILDQADALRTKRRHALAQLDSLTQSIFIEMFGDPAANPRGWPQLGVGDTAAKFSDGPFGSNLKSSDYTEAGVRVIRLQNIGVGELVDKDKAFVSEEHFNKLRKHECLPGDVLVGTLGNPNPRACIQPSTLARALNKADCVQLRPDPKIANAEYLCALLNQPAVESMAQEFMLGQTRVRISMGRLRGLQVPVPPLALQQAFATRIQAVQALKATHRAALAEQDALFASLQHRAFAGQLS